MCDAVIPSQSLDDTMTLAKRQRDNARQEMNAIYKKWEAACKNISAMEAEVKTAMALSKLMLGRDAFATAITESTGLQNLLRSTAEKLVARRAERDAVYREYISAQTTHHTAKSIVDEIANAPPETNLICRLPDEILSRILFLAGGARYHTVCRRWREVVRSDPSLSWRVWVSHNRDRLKIQRPLTPHSRKIVLAEHKGQIAVGTSRGSVQLWSLEGEKKQIYSLYGNKAAVTAMCSFGGLLHVGYSDGRVITYDGDDRVGTWDINPSGSDAINVICVFRAHILIATENAHVVYRYRDWLAGAEPKPLSPIRILYAVAGRRCIFILSPEKPILRAFLTDAGVQIGKAIMGMQPIWRNPKRECVGLLTLHGMLIVVRRDCVTYLTQMGKTTQMVEGNVRAGAVVNGRLVIATASKMFISRPAFSDYVAIESSATTSSCTAQAAAM